MSGTGDLLDLRPAWREAGSGLVDVLQQSEIAHYLLSLGLVKPPAVLDGELTVVDASRRNCVFVAATASGPAYVVKQAGPRSAGTLDHEATVLRFLESKTELAGLVPTVVHHDSHAARLVMRSPGAARDWSQHHRAGRFPTTPARLLGRALAALHRIPAERVGPPPPGADPMWALSLPEPPYELLLDLSAAAQDLVARLQANQAVCERLATLRDADADGALVHGDLRWDNCLAVPAPGSRRRTRLLLVDWELAGRGAPGYDVGTVLAEYLHAWVVSIPIVQPANPGRLVARAAHPLRRMEPAIRSFWAAYTTANPQRPTLRRVIELAAARILQTAVEHAQELAEPSAHVVTLMQLSENMLRRPEDAALSLLGLRE